MFCFFTSFMAKAQEDTRIGGFLAYGTEIKAVGFGANTEFPIIKNLTIAPSLIYYLPKDEDIIKITIFEINGNANFYFANNDKISFHGLARLKYTSVKVEVKEVCFELGGSSVSDG